MTMTTTARIERLDSIGKSLKKAMAESLEREAPVIIYHPSRLPTSEEFTALFSISSGQAVEHDIRAGRSGYSVQHGKLTDRLKAWVTVPGKDSGMLEELFGNARAKEITEVISSRDNSGKPFTMDTLRNNLLVKDLTLEELQKIALMGSEEVLGIKQFLDLYMRFNSGPVKPGKLAIDVKDGDETASGSRSLAVKATKVMVDELDVRMLNDALLMVMQYSIPAFTASRKILQDKAPSVCVISNRIARRYGRDAFETYANKAVEDSGAEWIGCNIGQLKILDRIIRKPDGPRVMIYVPPRESRDIDMLMKVLRNYPAIKAIQIDA